MEIPKQGMTREEIFETLKIVKSHDAQWDDGRMYAYVYDPGEAVREIGRDAYAAYLVENGLDPTAFPSVVKLENDVVSAIIALLRGDESVVGNMTTGGTESIMLAIKAGRDWARAFKPEIKQPEIIVARTAHHAFHKAGDYLGLKLVMVDFDHDTYRVDVEKMREAITPNTIMLVGSAPAYSQGVVDPIPEIAALAQEHGLLCHVDACVGGIHLAFMRKLGMHVPEYDWSVPGVTSISTDLHKFGYCPKQASVVMYRDRGLRRFQIYTSTSTTCYTLINTTIMSTKSGGPAAGAWAVLNFLGESGYQKIVSDVQSATEKMIAGVDSIPELSVMGNPDMSLFAFTSNTINLFQLADVMVAKGWIIQPQFGKPGAQTNLHISVNFGNVPQADAFVDALRDSVEEVKRLPPIDATAIQVELSKLVENNDPNLFEKAAAMVGIADGALPQGMALVNTLLSAMPDELQSQFLVEYFNVLYN